MRSTSKKGKLVITLDIDPLVNLQFSQACLGRKVITVILGSLHAFATFNKLLSKTAGRIAKKQTITGASGVGIQCTQDSFVLYVLKLPLRRFGAFALRLITSLNDLSQSEKDRARLSDVGSMSLNVKRDRFTLSVKGHTGDHSVYLRCLAGRSANLANMFDLLYVYSEYRQYV